MLNLNYDSAFDVLYLGFADKSNSYGDEIKNGHVLMIDEDTQTITGLTIFDFMHRYKNGTLEDLSLPISIDYAVDVIPRLHLSASAVAV